MRFNGLRRRALTREAARPSRRRWAQRALLGLATFAALVVVAVVVLLHDLDQPWLKRRVQAMARASAGLDIDYASVRVALLSGAVVEGLVVQTPAEFRALAPDLAAVDHIEARWSPSSLFGRGPAIEVLTISGLAVTIVADERGRTSLDALSPPDSTRKSPAPGVPLSRQAAAWLTAPPPVGKVNVDRVVLTWVRAEHAEITDRTVLRGVSLAVAAMPAAEGWRVQAGLGSPEAPLPLEVEHERAGAPAGAARASLWLTFDATSSALALGLDLRVIEQTLAPGLGLDGQNDRLHAQANLRFDAAAGRTTITLDHTDVGEGAATAEASIDVPDVGDPLVRHAQGDVDVARVLATLGGWLPPGLVPLTAERARIRYEVDSLALGKAARLSEGGSIALDADVANVRVTLGAGALDLRAGKLSVHGSPAPGGGVAVRASADLADVRLATGSDRVAVETLAVDLEGRQDADGAIAGKAALRCSRANRGGASPVAVNDGVLEVLVEGLHPDTDVPLATRGDVTVSGTLKSLDARPSGAHAMVDGLTLRAHALLEGHAPLAIEMGAQASRVRLLGSGERPLVDAPGQLDVAVHDFTPDVAAPASSRGAARIAVALGALRVSVDATKAVDAVDFAIHGSAPGLRAVVPLLPPDLAVAAPWGQMAVTVQSTGHVDHLTGSNPALRQSTTIQIERPAFGALAARSLSLDVRSDGTAMRQVADADLRVQALALDGAEPSDDRVTVSGTLDRERPSLHVQVATAGRATSKLSASVSFDRVRRAVVYEIDGTLAGLAPLAPLASRIRGLEGFDLSQLEIGCSARGALLGVVSSVSHDGAIGLEPQPSRTAAVEGTTEVRVAHLRWTRGDTALVTPSAAWHAEMRVVDGRRTMNSRVDLEALHLGLGRNEVDLAGISDDASATVTGDLMDPVAELTVRAAVRDVRQDAVPEYPVGDVTFALSAQRDAEGLVHVSDLEIVNGAGGTSLGLTGSVDLGSRRRRLSLAAHLAQDLEPLSRAPERFAGGGKAKLDATFESPDLALFRTRIDLKVEDVHVRMPRAGIDVEAANGVIPITTAFEIGTVGEAGKTAVTFRRDAERNPYSMLRFADQHALLSRTGYISIGSVKTPFASIAPLAGNLAIEQNVVSLTQFEMGVRGGSITGQCALDWEGARSPLELHVRATGVQSSHGEPFDGNVAVAIALADRTVEGRAEIVKIGPRHLLDLLDMEDPMRVDPAMNRIRTALAFGYPKRLRLVFDHGFASARLELGGLASLVSIGELKGLPMGPIVDKFLAPVLDAP